MSAAVFSTSLRDRLETREAMAESVLSEALQRAGIELSDEQRAALLQQVGPVTWQLWDIAIDEASMVSRKWMPHG